MFDCPASTNTRTGGSGSGSGAVCAIATPPASAHNDHAMARFDEPNLPAIRAFIGTTMPRGARCVHPLAAKPAQRSRQNGESRGNDPPWAPCHAPRWYSVLVQPSLSTHQSLLQRLAAGGDSGAWLEFTTRYRDLLVGFARRRGLQQADTDDLLQDLWLQLSRQLPEFRYDRDRGRFRGFLKTIAMRAIGKRLRRRDLAPLVADVAETDLAETDVADVAAEDAWEAEWRQHHLRSAMACIQREFRATDVRAFQELTQRQRAPAELAAELGVSPAAIYQIKSRILARLRTCIAEQVADEG